MHNDIQRIGNLSMDGVFIYDLRAARFRYLNEPFARIFNIKKELLQDQPKLMLPLIRSEDAYYLRHRLLDLERDSSISNTEFRLHFSDGTIRHLACDAYLLDDPSLIVGFVKDFTREKEHEDYIINYGARKDTLLDMMTHNLSGPLHLSQNILRWMQETYHDKTPDEISAQLHIIQENTKHCLDIVNDFLKQEHMESERIYVKKTRFDVLERIIATLDRLIASNRDKKFRLITDLESLNITTDSVKFFQIIHNLVSNAIKFTPVNGEIDILVEETEQTFVIRVRDNGIGIPAALHASLFEKRTPSRREGLNSEASTGLGLSIVKNLTELLNGKVSFETEENKGSVFTLELPKD
ncbi:MAG: HAMP domain-containing sensor histidine kinase [Chitinophagaceae bacterium]